MGGRWEASEADGVETFLQQLQDALVTRTYRPRRLRHKAIPQGNGQGVRVLSLPTIRDRVVPGAFKLILEPSFEADFQPGSYGYRPKRSAHDAVLRVAEAIVQDKTRVIDVESARRPSTIFGITSSWHKSAQRVKDPRGAARGQAGAARLGQEGRCARRGLSPLLVNLSLTAGERMLERAKEVTRRGSYTSRE